MAMGTTDSQDVTSKFLELRKNFAQDLKDAVASYEKDDGIRNLEALTAAKEYSRTMDVLVSRMTGAAYPEDDDPSFDPSYNPDLSSVFSRRFTLWEAIGELMDITGAAERKELKYRKILAGPAFGNALTYTYARDIHSTAAARFRDTLQLLQKLTIEVADKPIACGLKLLRPELATDSAEVYNIKEGYEGAHDLLPQVAMKTWQKVTEAGYARAKAVANLGPEISDRIAAANGYKNIRCATRNISINNASGFANNPIYVYQMKAVVPMTFGDPAILHGGYFISGKKMPEAAMIAENVTGL